MARERQWYEHNILFCEVVLSTIGKQYHSSGLSLSPSFLLLFQVHSHRG